VYFMWSLNREYLCMEENLNHSSNGVDTINPKTQRKRKPWIYLSEYEQVIRQRDKMRSWCFHLGWFSAANLIYWTIKIFS
jgi:hypothetical protein